MFHYIYTFIMFKHVNLGKHIWIHTSKIFKRYAHFKISSRDVVFTHLFFILGWNFIPVFLTGMSSSQDEISSRQKRVNSKWHFTINRDDFVPRRVSYGDETSHLNTFSVFSLVGKLLLNVSYEKFGVLITQKQHDNAQGEFV